MMQTGWLQRIVEWWPNLGARAYEAARPTAYHPKRGRTESGDAIMQQAGPSLRNLCRYLEENHDLAGAVLQDLVNNTVGDGVSIEPMVRLRDGSLAEETNAQISELLQEWKHYPEVTEEMNFSAFERMMALHYFRDGEVFYQMIGDPSFDYRTPVPYVIRGIDPDYVPFELTAADRGITHGVERDNWGRTVAFHVLIQHPGDLVNYPLAQIGETQRISAATMRQLKRASRLNQARGVPILHNVINRLRDVKDYEESERIAARVGSSIALAIEKDMATQVPEGAEDRNEIIMEAGAIFDLLPGEKISTVGQDRPNEKLIDFRNAMLRAVAGGTQTRFSAIAKDYSQGNYSSQRQELVEATVGYRAQFAYLRGRFYRPNYVRFLEQAFFSNQFRPQPRTDPKTLFRADFRPPALPWISPKEEATAWKILVEAGLESRSAIMRGRGRDPREVTAEIKRERESGIWDPISPQGSDQDQDQDQDQENDQDQDQDQGNDQDNDQGERSAAGAGN